jgi:molybdate transport system regulatory protein
MTPKDSALSIRIDLANGTRFGPGKAALLTAIQAETSISGAAKSLGMSYPRALKLIEQMNSAFNSPIVEAKHGGQKGGGASVTAKGLELLNLYNRISEDAQRTSKQDIQAIENLIKSR